MDPRHRLIVALDVSTAAAARKIVAAVGDSAFTYKVGMQLYTAEGPSIVRDLVSSGIRMTKEKSGKKGKFQLAGNRDESIKKK